MLVLGSSTGHLRLVVRVDVHVDPGPLGELALAVSAQVGLLARVQPLVIHPGLLGRESLPAEAADLRLLPRVGPLVLPHHVTVDRSVVTILTLEQCWRCLSVPQLGVLLQLLLIRQGEPALRADLWVHHVQGLLVH